MKKILIISSEPLNPGNLLGSIFELEQAKALRESYQVVILAVRDRGSLLLHLKRLIKTLTTMSFSIAKISGLVRDIKGSIRSIVGSKVFVSEFVIGGISVFECQLHAIYSSKSFLDYLQSWAYAGRQGFLRYKDKFGLPNIVHAHGRFLSAGFLAQKMNEEYRIPFIYSEHSSFYHTGKAAVESKALLLDIMNRASVFIVVSPSLLNDIAIFLGRQVENARIIPNLLDSYYLESVNARKFTADRFEFITIGALEPVKGMDILIKAFSKRFGGNLKFALRIVGGGSQVHNLKVMVGELGLRDQIIFEGYKTKEAIRKLLDHADVFISSSRYETFGVAIIEAMAMGLPIIATKCGGPEFTVNEQIGILTNPNDVDGLASAMKKMTEEIDNYDSKYISDYAQMKFGTETFLREMKSIYEGI